jgi:hypothetical protein
MNLLDKEFWMFLRVDGTVFFGPELTYLKLGRDLLFFLGLALLQHLYMESQSSSTVSWISQLLYTMANAAQLLSNFPWDFIDYDVLLPLFGFAVCLMSLMSHKSYLNSSTEDYFW